MCMSVYKRYMHRKRREGERDEQLRKRVRSKGETETEVKKN